ncbi:hypothetical protein VTK26DRAFT_7571 [Humicola hyalothermophila]
MSSGHLKMPVCFIIVTVNLSLGVVVAVTHCQDLAAGAGGGVLAEGVANLVEHIYTDQFYSGAMDIVLALLSWKIIWTLTMNKKEKSGMLVAMSTGCLVRSRLPIFLCSVFQAPTTFTNSTAQLVILAAAESAITIAARR